MVYYANGLDYEVYAKIYRLKGTTSRTRSDADNRFTRNGYRLEWVTKFTRSGTDNEVHMKRDTYLGGIRSSHGAIPIRTEYEVHMKRYLSERSTKLRRSDTYWDGIQSSHGATPIRTKYEVHMLSLIHI